MAFLMMIGGLLVATVGQFLNAKTAIPSTVVKIALAMIGVGMYLVIAQPTAWVGQPLLDWADKAWLWALALPGAASLIGTTPGMKTVDAPKP